jgi:hypothetical protein
MRSTLLVMLLLCGVVRGLLASSDTSLNSSECFVAPCTNFTFLTSALPVTVGGYFRTVTELTVASGNCVASGEFWLFWPVCTAWLDTGGEPVVVRPDLTAFLYNSGNPIRVSALLANPNCDLRPGFAYQRWTFTGVFEQDLGFRSYPLDRHFLLVQVSDSTYNESQVIYQPDNVHVTSTLDNVVQVSYCDILTFLVLTDSQVEWLAARTQ